MQYIIQKNSAINYLDKIWEKKVVLHWDYNVENAYELWDIYDFNRKYRGYKKYRKSELEDDEYHLVVRIWIVNSENKILLSKRNPNKRRGNLWECTGGSALSGETTEMAAIREVYEELRIKLDIKNGIKVRSLRRDTMHDFYDIWLFRKDIELCDIKYNKKEVVDVKWVTLNELKKMYLNNEMIPSSKIFFDIYKETIL